MKAWVLSSGDEIVEGRLQDSNAALIAAYLADHGVRTVRMVAVGDRRDDLLRVLRQAEDEVDIVVMTGGLGATRDDLTREVLAEAAGVGIEFRTEAEESIAAFWQARNRAAPPKPWPECYAPAGARLILNPIGIAPAIHVTLRRLHVFAFPGVPFELESLLEHGAMTEVLKQAPPTARCDIGVAGLAESVAAARLGALLDRGRTPLVGICAKDGYLMLHVRASAETHEEARRLVEEDRSQILRVLGADVFSDRGETPAAAVIRRLNDRGRRLAVAESLTGGLIGHWLTEVAGASAVFLAGYVCYSNDAKIDAIQVPPRIIEESGAVSIPCAEAMARGARERAGADYGVATTGIAGPAGGSEGKPVGTVMVAVASPDGRVVSRTHAFGGGRKGIKTRAAHAALDLLRRALDAIIPP